MPLDKRRDMPYITCMDANQTTANQYRTANRQRVIDAAASVLSGARPGNKLAAHVAMAAVIDADVMDLILGVETSDADLNAAICAEYARRTARGDTSYTV